MQRHRKYLVITIWISTFAFIGAGFVGWGQYSYGDKAGAVAKVGDIAISQREWQQAYSRLYGQYNQVFQGNFDEKQAESFGLKQQAMRQVVEQGLILNLANSYNLKVTKEELSKVIVAQDMFFEDGKFSKELYVKLLKQNNLNVADYENDLRKSILIQKVLSLFQSEPLPFEEKIFTTVNNITDKIEYKVLNANDITLDLSDKALKAFWETHQQNYMHKPSFTLQVVTQEKISANADASAVQEHYKANRTHYTDAEGKILELDAARALVIASLDEKATNKQALRSYIAFKKGNLESGIAVETITVDEDNNPFTAEIFTEITALNSTSPFMKPRKLSDKYVTIKLEQANPAIVKSFDDAKSAVLVDYKRQQSAQKLQELANSSLKSFKGTQSNFITSTQSTPLSGLSQDETKLFVSKLFASLQKRGSVAVSNNKLVLFNITEQKLTDKTTGTEAAQAARLKASIFDASLIKLLETKFTIESYVGGN
ncbi:MAG: SurA N-terminal domain-containing protein [Helicobacteraceae bacterium]|nr:SurA N-terminal domain-containing protein [Helicobacteraceae bacterium]